MMKIRNFQHTRKSNISGVPKTLRVFEDAENHRFSCMKKAQVEIMGLTIALLLITLGIVFVFGFISENGSLQYKRQFTQTEIASNTLSTFLRTTSGCKELSMTELLQDCSQNQIVVCLEDQNSCEYVLAAAAQIFDDTLEKWGISYEFKVFFEEENPVLGIGEACVGDKKSKLFPIPIDSGILKVKMDICG